MRVVDGERVEVVLPSGLSECKLHQLLESSTLRNILDARDDSEEFDLSFPTGVGLPTWPVSFGLLNAAWQVGIGCKENVNK